MPSRARSEGLDAVDLSVAAEAEVDRMLGDVMPVVAENSEEEAEEIEPGPAWSIWLKKRGSSAISLLRSFNN
jgi:hypothetical protein